MRNKFHVGFELLPDHLSLSATHTFLIQRRGWIFQIDVCSENVRMGPELSFAPTMLLSRQHPRTRTVEICDGSSDFSTLDFSQSSFPKQSCQSRDPYRCRSRSTTVSSMVSECFRLRLGAHCIHTCGHSFSGHLSNLGATARGTCVAETASLASPCPGVWRLCPGMLPPFATLMPLAP